jgi:hypothetical protein
MTMVNVTLSEQEAQSFLKWREHQANFEILLENGVFDVRNGSVELHFNVAGHVASIDAHIKVFRAPIVIVKTISTPVPLDRTKSHPTDVL